MDLTNLPALPQWLQDELPEPREPLSISYDGQKFRLYHSQLSEQFFDTLEEAYDAARVVEQEHVDVVGGTIFDGELPAGYTGMGRGTFVTGGKTSRLMLFNEDTHALNMLKLSYQRWLEFVPLYEQYPEEFRTSYFFLTMHPMFWVRGTRSEDYAKQRPYDWDTENHINRAVLHKIYFEDGAHQHSLETGSHVPPHYTTQ